MSETEKTVETAAVLDDPAAIAGKRNRCLYEWWDRARAAAAMPPYAAFDPVEFRWALGHLSVATALPDGDYLYRVDGTAVVEYFGVEMTGKRLSAYPGDARRRRIRDSFDLVRAARKPVYVRRNTMVDGFVLHMHILLLPFGAPGAAVAEIMSCLAHGKALRNS